MGDPSPQAENGHIDIANEIAEALCCIQLSGYESRILWALFRKTYGWHKKEDKISLSQFQALTGLPIPKISNTLNRLALRKMISVTENGNSKPKSYGFQKVFTLWQGYPKKVLPKSGIPEKGITENGLQGLPKSASTKETITKEIKHTLGKKAKKDFCLPVWVPAEEWAAFVEMRIRIKKPMTDYAKQLRINDLERLMSQGENPAAVLNQSIAGSWQDLYATKKVLTATQPAAKPEISDKHAQILDKAMERYAD